MKPILIIQNHELKWSCSSDFIAKFKHAWQIKLLFSLMILELINDFWNGISSIHGIIVWQGKKYVNEVSSHLRDMESCIKANHLAYIGTWNQQFVLNCVITTLSCEKKHDILQCKKIILKPDLKIMVFSTRSHAHCLILLFSQDLHFHPCTTTFIDYLLQSLDNNRPGYNILEFWNFRIFKYKSVSWHVKQNFTSTITDVVYDLLHDLPDDLRLKILRNYKT